MQSSSARIGLLLLVCVLSSPIVAKESSTNTESGKLVQSSAAGNDSVTSRMMFKGFLGIFFLLLIFVFLFAPAAVSMSLGGTLAVAGAGAAGAVFAAKKFVDALPPPKRKQLFENPLTFSFLQFLGDGNHWRRWALDAIRRFWDEHPLIVVVLAICFGWFVLPIYSVLFVLQSFAFLVHSRPVFIILLLLLSLTLASVVSRPLLFGILGSMLGTSLVLSNWPTRDVLGTWKLGDLLCFLSVSMFFSASLQFVGHWFRPNFPSPSTDVHESLLASPKLPDTFQAPPIGADTNWWFHNPKLMVLLGVCALSIVCSIVICLILVLCHRKKAVNRLEELPSAYEGPAGSGWGPMSRSRS
jgi:hypothetical protein